MTLQKKMRNKVETCREPQPCHEHATRCGQPLVAFIVFLVHLLQPERHVDSFVFVLLESDMRNLWYCQYSICLAFKSFIPGQFYSISKATNCGAD